ncbi:MGMT family protein, partial [bacterium]|nr:MGMT family protein [bacterium]
IAAEAAEEDRANGKTRITPYWRVLKSDGSLNEKYPGGVKSQSVRLKEEGHTLLSGKGKGAPKVKDFEKYLASL